MGSPRAGTLTLATAWLSCLACVPALVACGSGSGSGPEEEALFVPEGLSVVPASIGGNGAFNLIAFTLQEGRSSAELYVALRNDGEEPACSPGFSVEFFDEAEESLARGVGGLLVRRFYRTTDGTDTRAACIAPGEVTMAAILDLPSDLLTQVSHGTYWLTYWGLDVAPIEGISIADVRATTGSAGVAYRGELVNGLAVAVSQSVAVFPVNRVGRPLGVAMARGPDQVPPGGRWEFETNTVPEAGVAHAAFPGGG